jgi:hypothetical protein
VTEQLSISVLGRPAPQGSKDGNMREQSVYLPKWRADIKKAVYVRYAELGITPRDLAARPKGVLLAGPVGFSCAFWLDTGQRIDSPPDMDKLIRATWDALTKARVWEDDGRVVALREVRKAQATDRPTGADIWVWREGEGNE